MAQPLETAFPVRQRMTYLALGVVAAASVFFVFAQTSGDAQEVDCDTIQKFVMESGELPRFSIDPDSGMVIVTTSRGRCRETTEKWTQRNWLDVSKDKQPATQQPPPKPKPAPRPAAVPSPDRAAPAPSEAKPPARPFETHPLFRDVEPKREAPEPAEAKRSRPPGECVPLKDVWKPGDVTIRGHRYMIARAFTLDDNDDGVVDDVGFRVQSESGQEFDMRYFPGPGSLFGKSIEGLRLDDESVIPRLCFGSVDLLAARPPKKSEAPRPPVRAFEVPDLAKEFAQRQGGQAPAQVPESGPSPRILLLAGGVAGGIIVVAGIALFFTRRMWLPKPKPALDEADDEEDDRDERADATRMDDEDEQEADEEEEDDKPKKKKGLFGRKKR